MSDVAAKTAQILSLPQGGGSLSGIGEKFSPDLFTGTGNFSVPLALPTGRNNFAPELALAYSTGTGNGIFGLGWNINIPEISRKTSGGVPLYNELHPVPETTTQDTFILSGNEDLSPVAGSYPGHTQYRPRTEGFFARIVHTIEANGSNFWTVSSKSGLTSVFGLPAHKAALVNPANPAQIFAWKLSETRDEYGNLIRYSYLSDSGDHAGHTWQLPLIEQISYVDYGDPNRTRFLVNVVFEYEDRPDPFSTYRAGFEIRLTKRCTRIKISTNLATGDTLPVREYRFSYDAATHNAQSLLQQIEVIGFDDDGNAYDQPDQNSPYAKVLPPLTFDYTDIDPSQQRLQVVEGNDCPVNALNRPDIALVDLHGAGLPDICQINGVTRYWRNLGNGRFDRPREMVAMPPHTLLDPGVQLIDADGNGCPDLLVTHNGLSGYYPLQHGAVWSKASFQPYAFAPSVDADNPHVRFVDLSGDGRTDILHSSTRLEGFFNHSNPDTAWRQMKVASFTEPSPLPPIDFADPRVHLADMTGDGLSDIVLVHDRNIEYWPNLGHNRWGKRISMRHSPRLTTQGYALNYDPKRLLIGDVDGDGLADIVYVGNNNVQVWFNQSGNAWSTEPIIIRGTPLLNDTNDVRLIDLNGTGTAGLLWSRDAHSSHENTMLYLDLCGGQKPHLLNKVDNHIGAITQIEYQSSTHYLLQDRRSPATQWQTPLPFPVQVVAKVTQVDSVSKAKRSTVYRYHHGYWDGTEREFRGFGLVEQFDTETFEEYHADLATNPDAFQPVENTHFSPPTLTKTWFHQGPIGEVFDDWTEQNHTASYWNSDAYTEQHQTQINAFLATYTDLPNGVASARNRRIKRDALRTLRGSILRTEVYALDGSDHEPRPYTVVDYAYNLKEIDPLAGETAHPRIFFPHLVSQRTVQWERGDDPLVTFSLLDYLNENGEFDAFGRPRCTTEIAMPRLTKHQQTTQVGIIGDFNPNQTHVLAACTHTFYAKPESNTVYIHDRVAETKGYALHNPPAVVDSNSDTLEIALQKQANLAHTLHNMCSIDPTDDFTLIRHEIMYYDGTDFVGLESGKLGEHGTLVRRETLAFTEALLTEAYADRQPTYLGGNSELPANLPTPTVPELGYRLMAGGLTPHEEGYYIELLRQRVTSRGLTSELQDPKGHSTVVTYDDPYHLLPLTVTDTQGLAITATYNYRLLKPASITDANGNSTHLAYTSTGLVHKQYVVAQSANGEPLGGTLTQPDIMFDYDFLNFSKIGAPIFVHTTRRIHHAHDNISDATIASRDYSDGFGRVIQSRVQAEDIVLSEDHVANDQTNGSGFPASSVANYVADSVIVDGWTRLDNKGQAVEAFEPFYGVGWDFQPEVEARYGVSTQSFYDPRGMLVRIVKPDGATQRYVQGYPTAPTNLALSALDLLSSAVPGGFVPSPWESYVYDANDLASIAPAQSSAAPAQHFNTPASTVLDAMGRVCCTIARNGPDRQEWSATHSTYDLRGNLQSITDELDRRAFVYHYDLLDRLLAVTSIDAGKRTSVFDAAGQLVEYRDSKGTLAYYRYDDINRLKAMWARDSAGGHCTLREYVEYGDDGSRDIARQNNTLGRPVLHLDEAGLLEMPRYDFKGNLLEKQRRTIANRYLANAWQPDWSVADAQDALEPEQHQVSKQYDALNRLVQIQFPQDIDGDRKALHIHYNRGGKLRAVELNDEPYVQHIAYNARGQRLLIAYGNDLMTRYRYDPTTFNLVHFRTEHVSHERDANGHSETWHAGGKVFQDFRYAYDLNANVVRIIEQTSGCGIANSQQGVDQLIREFEYDALNRLIGATGRACKDIGVPRVLRDEARCGFYGNGTPTPSPGNAPNLTEHYRETYTYDPAGNILKLTYHAQSGHWSRLMGLGGVPDDEWPEAANNQLTSLKSGGVVHQFSYDANGNLIKQDADKHHIWNHADHMVGFRVQADEHNPASISTEARYLYGSDGNRVKKWVRNQQGHVTSTTYIDGIFEKHQVETNSSTSSNNVLHVMDDQARIALVRVGAALDSNDISPQVQYQLNDHVASSHIVVGGELHNAADFVQREEYFPYGETSFGSFGRKRYRYSGKERDEESGLSYYGARYFAPGFARWISCDPIGRSDDNNLYQFSKWNSISLKDTTGLETDELDNITKKDIKRWEKSFDEGIKPDRKPKFMDKLRKMKGALGLKALMDFSDDQPGITPQMAGNAQAQIVAPEEHTPPISQNPSVGPDPESPKPPKPPEPRMFSDKDIAEWEKSVDKEIAERSKRPPPPPARGDSNKPIKRTVGPSSGNPVAVISGDFGKAAPATSSRWKKVGKELIEVVVKRGKNFVPVVGTGAGAATAAYKLSEGNVSEAYLEAAGASEVPIVAQAADTALLVQDVGWVAKDAIDPDQKAEQWAHENLPSWLGF